MTREADAPMCPGKAECRKECAKPGATYINPDQAPGMSFGDGADRWADALGATFAADNWESVKLAQALAGMSEGPATLIEIICAGFEGS